MIDWRQAALNIRASGLALERASLMLGKHRGWLSQIARGEIAEPHFTDGVKLLDLHYDMCKERHYGILK